MSSNDLSAIDDKRFAELVASVMNDVQSKKKSNKLKSFALKTLGWLTDISMRIAAGVYAAWMFSMAWNVLVTKVYGVAPITTLQAYVAIMIVGALHLGYFILYVMDTAKSLTTYQKVIRTITSVILTLIGSSAVFVAANVINWLFV